MKQNILKLFLITTLILLTTSIVMAESSPVTREGIGLEITPSIWKNTDTNILLIGDTTTIATDFCLNTKDSETNSKCLLLGEIVKDGDKNYFKLSSFEKDTNKLSFENGPNKLFAFLKNGGIYSKYKELEFIEFILDINAPNIEITGIEDKNYDFEETPKFDLKIEVSDDFSKIDTIIYKLIGTNFSEELIIKRENDYDFKNDETTILTREDDSNKIINLEIKNLELLENNYELIVDANDVLGHSSTKTISFVVDANKPKINSVTPKYVSGFTHTNNKKVSLEFNVSEVTPTTLFFTCDEKHDLKHWFKTDYSKIVNSFDIINSEYSCNKTNGQKKVYVVLRDFFGRDSNVYEIKINFDDTLPSNPTNVIAEPGNGEVKLSWTKANSDNESGNKHYKIYVNNDEKKITTKQTETITGLENNRNYSFRVVTVDNAENESKGVTINATPTECSAKISIKKSGEETNTTKNNDLLEVTCSLGEKVNNAKIMYKTYLGTSNSSSKTLKETSNTNSVTSTLTINSNEYDKVLFWCEVNNNNLNVEKMVYVDDNPPTIIINELPSVLTETTKIITNITDNKEVNKVEFEINNTKYSPKQSNNEYYYDLDTTLIPNGLYDLTIIAHDEAGNKSQKKVSVRIENILTEEQGIITSINNAKKKKIIVEDLIQYYFERGLKLSDETLNEKTRADKLLIEAEEQKNSSSKTKANEAKEIYTIINESMIFETITNKMFEYEKENLDQYLPNELLTTNQANQAKTNAINSNANRKISVIKIGTNNYIQIEISFSIENNDSYKIIEVIPKEFVENASQVFSNTEYNIIEEDPIIEFIVTNNTKKVYYSFSVSEEKASQLMNDESIKKFYIPIIVDSKEKIVKEQNPNIFLIVIVLIIILIIVGFITISFLGNGKKDEITKKIGEMFKQNPQKKWKYKK